MKPNITVAETRNQMEYFKEGSFSLLWSFDNQFLVFKFFITLTLSSITFTAVLSRYNEKHTLFLFLSYYYNDKFNTEVSYFIAFIYSTFNASKRCCCFYVMLAKCSIIQKKLIYIESLAPLRIGQFFTYTLSLFQIIMLWRFHPFSVFFAYLLHEVPSKNLVLPFFM